jgi:hypothetical protein
MICLMIPFNCFKSKIEITKQYDGKGKMEIIDNKYVMVVIDDGSERQ